MTTPRRLDDVQVARARQLALAGLSATEISAELGESRATVRRAVLGLGAYAEGCLPENGPVAIPPPEGLVNGIRRGERHPAAKLTCADVARIRSAPSEVTNRALGRELGIHDSVVSKIRRGLAWRGGGTP